MANRLKWVIAAGVAAAAVLVAILTIGGGQEPRHSQPSFSVPRGGDGDGRGAGVAAGGGRQLRGAMTHPLWWDSSTADFDRELDLLKAAGADTVRMDIAWSSLETEGKGRFSSWYVEKADTFLNHARERGLGVIATLWATPCWASSAPEADKQGCAGAWWDRGVDRWAPANAGDYADAASWVARRWGGSLTALEIWNEPNLPDQYSLRAPDPAAAYADILKTAYPRVKEAAPNVTVLGGVLAFSDGEFLERLYDLGIGGRFDGLSIHPYNEWRDPDDRWKPEFKKYTYLTGVPWIQSILAKHGDGDRGLWLTEFGFSTCGTGSKWCVTPEQQAEYIADSFRIAAGWPYVKAAIAYNLRNKGSVPTDREDQFGLVHRDFSLKPGYAAFQAALAGAAADDAVPDAPAGPTPAGAGSGTGAGTPSGKNPPSAAPLPYTVTIGKVRRSGRAASVRVRCRPGATRRCRGTLTLRSPRGRVLGRAKLDRPRGSGVVRVRLTAAGRTALRGTRRVKVVATVTAARGVRIARLDLRA